MSEFDDLTLNLDPALTGAVTTTYTTAGNGVDVLDMQIKVGGVTVAVIDGGIHALPGDGPPDPLPLTILRV